MLPLFAEGRTRTGKACATDTSSLRVYQFHHSGNSFNGDLKVELELLGTLGLA